MKKKNVTLTKELGEKYERASKVAQVYEEHIFLKLMASFAQTESTVNRADFLIAEQLVKKVGL